ncbi:MAG TPA: UDP-N-acetylmuramoyl-L-alanyl-D-glutamate--2,6-diaminopimelate ligase [Gammaproteobacteria bacterium]|nr:UDP-N-acetylmuramoyl-L-alanyl-D-glutamate--2,6-diaminopimelate ligase [Gammaproteobacteria bacterium]
MAARATIANIRLGELLHGLASVPSAVDCEIAGVALDSREVATGGLFLACRGTQRHGLEFLDAALARGAAAVAWEPAEGLAPLAPKGVALVAVPNLGRHVSEIAARFYGEPSRALDVIGVTGTNGKSSTVLMTAEALTALATPAGVIGTLGAGRPGQLTESGLTTPDAVAVQRLLARMRDDGAAAVAMEASSHGLDQGRVEAVHFRVAVFTNLTRDHLDYHGSERAYAEAKARLFAWPGLGAAVLNLDDPLGRELFDRLDSKVAAIGYTLTGRRAPHGRTLAAQVATGANGVELDIYGDWGRARVKSPLIGRFNAANLLAVLGALLALDKPFDAAAASLANVHAAPGRMECFGGPDDVKPRPLVIVDYAHTPDALDKVLAAAREHARGRVLAVFGCGGDRDRGKRPLMAKIAACYADISIVTDDNPRTENPAAIVAEILAGFPADATVQVEHDRRRAIAAALAEARPGDAVVVAGKGHETYQIVGNEHRPFDDREVVRALLAGEGEQ